MNAATQTNAAFVEFAETFGAPQKVFPLIPADQLLTEADLRQLASACGYKQGKCDLCERWDGNLQAGIGGCCRDRLSVVLSPSSEGLPPHASIRIESTPYRHDWLPCNDAFATGLAVATRALRLLDELRALVIGIELRGEWPVIRLGREAPIEIPGERIVTICGSQADKTTVGRVSFAGCLLEWRAHQ